VTGRAAAEAIAGGAIAVLLGRTADVADAVDVVCAGEREEALGYGRGAHDFLRGRAFTRLAIGRITGRDPRHLRFRRTPHRRPLLDDANGLDFSLSHAEGLVALALARGRRVGVDVESTKSRRNLEAIIEEALPAVHAAALRNMPAALPLLWARLEATAKVCGRGLRFPLEDTLALGLHEARFECGSGACGVLAYDGDVTRVRVFAEFSVRGENP
jgi:phosphopantetheinyl transferase